MNNFTKRIAVDLAIPQDVVEKVIEYGIEEMLKAMRECNSTEITGFGTFHFRKNTLPYYISVHEKKIEELERKLLLDLSPVRRENAELKLEKLRNDLSMLRKRYELEPDFRGVEE